MASQKLLTGPAHATVILRVTMGIFMVVEVLVMVWVMMRRMWRMMVVWVSRWVMRRSVWVMRGSVVGVWVMVVGRRRRRSMGVVMWSRWVVVRPMAIETMPEVRLNTGMRVAGPIRHLNHPQVFAVPTKKMLCTGTYNTAR